MPNILATGLKHPVVARSQSFPTLLRGQDLRLLIEKGIFVLVDTTGHFMSTYLLTSE